MCLERLLSLHFKYEGITYRDCTDAAQAGAHVVGITSALASQPYKVWRCWCGCSLPVTCRLAFPSLLTASVVTWFHALLLLQGGDDVLAALSMKDFCALEATSEYAGLTEQEGRCAKLLTSMDGTGGKLACAMAKHFGTFGGIANHHDTTGQGQQQACKDVAVLKTSTGRNVGPSAAKKLLFYLTCENPDAVFDGV